MKYTTTAVHINTISPSDYVKHNGEVVTVSSSDIKTSPFMGRTLFGDSYHIGYKPVKKVTILKCVN